MSATGQFGVTTSDKLKELNMANYIGNVSNHFSKMHPAECLNGVTDFPSKLEDGNEVLQQKLENYIINSETISPTSTHTPNPLDESDNICESNLISPSGGTGFTDLTLVANNKSSTDIGQVSKGDPITTLAPTQLYNGICNETFLSPEVTSVHSLSSENHNTSGSLDSSRNSLTKATLPSAQTSDVRGQGVTAGAGDAVEDTGESVCGVAPSTASSKNSLHVQFEEGSRDQPERTAESQPARESPTFSLTSESSSEEEESSLEDLADRAPDGGYGWVVVAAAFFTNLIADGITFTFGVIFVEFLKHFKQAKSKTAWIAGTFMAMPLLSGPLASYLTDRFGCRKVCMFGSVLACIGFIISSQAQSIEVLILSFGILSGFGLAMCFVSAVVIVAYYFEKKRSLATGLSVCGSGLGTSAFAPLSSMLIKEYGWRGTMLIMAGFVLNIMVCGALMRDLEWTKAKMKAQRRDRKMRHRKKRSLKSQSQSLRTATSSVGSLNPSKNLSIDELKRLLRSGEQMIPVADEQPHGAEEVTRLCSSVIHLPTFLRNGEKVPVEVLELLSTNKQLHDVVLMNYPSFLVPTRSNSDVGFLNVSPDKKAELVVGNGHAIGGDLEPAANLMLPGSSGYDQEPKQHFVTLPRGFLRHNHVVPRRSLTYRGAMLNFNQYRTRAVSCPDISRNSMVSIPQQNTQWYECFWDLRDVLADMVDISHFSDVRFLLFAISNFILYSFYDVPYVFIADKAVEMNFSETDASYLISTLGIVNTFGEILFGWMGDLPWVNAGVVYALCMGACGVVLIAIPLLTSYIGLSVASGGFGLFISANYSLSSIILVELISLDRFTNAYGLLLFVQGTANLVGPSFAGWLCDVSGNYDLSFYLAGIFIIFCGIILVILPTMKWCKKRRRRRLQTGSPVVASKLGSSPSRSGFLTGETEKLPV